MEMISAFTDVLHVPNLTTDSQMMNVLKQSDAFSKDDLAKLASKLKGRKASIGRNCFVLKEQLGQDFLKYFWGGFFYILFQHCFICLPSDSTVPTDAGIEPRTVASCNWCIGSQTL
jgi:hypothetical protein